MKTTKSPSTDILNAVAKSVWEDMGHNEEKLPDVTPDDIREWMPNVETKEIRKIIKEKLETPLPQKPEPETWTRKMWYRIERCRAQHYQDFPEKYAFPIPISFKDKISPSNYEKSKKGVTLADLIAIFKDIIQNGLYEEFEQAVQEEDNKDMLQLIKDNEVQVRDHMYLAFYILMSKTESEAVAELYDVPTYEDCIVAIHNLWKAVNEKHERKFLHPLGPIVEEYLKDTNAKHISAENDRKYPVAVINPLWGCVKTLQFTNGEIAHLREFATPESIEPVRTSLFETQSLLPSVLPLDVAHPLGVKPTTKKGAVSHVIRIFFEALMALEPRQTKMDIWFELGDLINFLYPDGKFNRTNQLPLIIRALEILHANATVLYKQDNGDIGRWNPVVVRSVIGDFSKNDTRILLDVRLPPDATQGMLVQKDIIRILGKKSAPQFSAYLSSCFVWDKYGTVNGTLIDPTQPIVNKDTDGYLVDPNGNRLIGSKGKPIKNPYRSDAIAQLEREPNPSREKYPILSDDDLIKACNISKTSSNRYRDLQRAKDYWTQLEKQGIVTIERLPQGWRIMPSEDHMQAYRAMTKAIQKLRE